jgi:hypothetical protein
MRRIASMGAIAALLFASMALSPARVSAVGLGSWLQYGGHWYAQVHDLGWGEADAFAVRHGGHLVTINDQSEQAFLEANFADPNLNIGLNDMAEEGTWVWSSGETATYDNWADGEPNDFEGVEDIAVMNFNGSGEWNDVAENYSSIIEMPAPFALNDHVADAIEVPFEPFDDSPDVTFAGWEPNEDVPCGSGQQTGSVWYRFTNPALSGLVVQIGGEQDQVTAAIYGPFDKAPSSVEGLIDRHQGRCVFGVGPDNAWTEGIAPGVWLIQLATNSASATPPSIHIERGFAYFWIDGGTISVDSAMIDRSGTIRLAGTAVCQFQHWSDGLPSAPFNWTGDNEGFFSYELQGWADQASGKKTLLTGGGGGYIDCTNLDQDNRGIWQLWVRANNGRFGPNWTNFGFEIGLGTCDENGCWFNQIAGFGDYLKVVKGR